MEQNRRAEVSEAFRGGGWGDIYFDVRGYVEERVDVERGATGAHRAGLWSRLWSWITDDSNEPGGAPDPPPIVLPEDVLTERELGDPPSYAPLERLHETTTTMGTGDYYLESGRLRAAVEEGRVRERQVVEYLVVDPASSLPGEVRCERGMGEVLCGGRGLHRRWIGESSNARCAPVNWAPGVKDVLILIGAGGAAGP